MKILITGASGFVGRHLAQLLARSGAGELFGTYRTTEPPAGAAFIPRRLDLGDFDDTLALVRDLRPDRVYHLAAMSFPPAAGNDRLAAYDSNFQATLHLLEALAREAPNSRTLLVSSAEVYGKVDPAENPVSETRQPEPRTAYSASKQCAEIAARQFAAQPGLKVVIARPFNHTGPGQNEKFVAPAFAMQIARIEQGLQEPVVVTGNLDAERDFLDVRDVVAAYPSLLERGSPGEAYNICSGKPTGIGRILEMLLAMSGKPGAATAIDPARQRPSENPRVYGDNTKLFRLAGWAPSLPLERTLFDLLSVCREETSKRKTPVDSVQSSR